MLLGLPHSCGCKPLGGAEAKVHVVDWNYLRSLLLRMPMSIYRWIPMLGRKVSLMKTGEEDHR